MAIPKFEDFLYPFMQHLLETDSNKADMIETLSAHFNLTAEDRLLRTKGGSALQIKDRIGWGLQWLRRALFVDIPKQGVWRITQRGRDYMMSHGDLRESDLMEYPEFAEYSGRQGKRKSKAKRTVASSAIDEAYLKPNDNWLEIVETVKPIIKACSSYSTFYDSIVSCFRLLGWKKSKGTIVTFPSNDSSVKEGVIFLNIENDNLHIPIVPLDQNVSYTEASRLDVLFKSMEEWKCVIGLLFSDSIQIFYKEQNEDGKPVCIASIQFDEKDVLGSALCNLLSFHTFNYKQLKLFCEKEYEKIPSSPNILKRLHILSADSQLVGMLVKNYLLSEGFGEETIANALDDYMFRIKIKGKKKKSTPEPTNPEQEEKVGIIISADSFSKFKRKK